MRQTLRDYQTDAVDQARAAITAGDHALITLPTGSGKTTVGAEIARLAVAKGGRVLWIAHRTELIDQAAERLRSFGLRVGEIKAGRSRDLSAPTQVASIQTLAARLSDPEIIEWVRSARVCITDEAHRTRAASYAAVREFMPRAAHIGLTATPVRLDGRGLGEVYDAIVCPTTSRDLIERGLLVEPVYFAASQPDLTGVKRTRGGRGEYEAKGSAKAMSAPQITGSIVDTYLRLAKGRKGVVFAAGVANSRALCQSFNDAGVNAAHVDGGTPEPERADILERLRSGALDLVCNVDVLTEGWDLPALEVCVDAAPTTSWGKFMQRVGRIMRPTGDQPMVLDHAGNLVRHGFPTDLVAFDLGDSPLKKGAPSKAKICQQCFAVMPVSKRVCTFCGAEFPKRVSGGPLLVAGELGEVKPDRPTPRQKHMRMEELLREASAKGFQMKWVVREFRETFGVAPRTSNGFNYALLKARAFRSCKHVRIVGGACAFCSDPSGMDEATRRAVKSRVLRNPSRANVQAIAREFGLEVGVAYGIAQA